MTAVWSAVEAMASRVMRDLRAIWDLRAEVAHITAVLGGWALLTWPVADLVGTWHPWALSGGLLLLSLAGWGHLRTLFHAGLYALTREEKRRG